MIIFEHIVALLFPFSFIIFPLFAPCHCYPGELVGAMNVRIRVENYQGVDGFKDLVKMPTRRFTVKLYRVKNRGKNIEPVGGPVETWMPYDTALVEMPKRWVEEMTRNEHGLTRNAEGRVIGFTKGNQFRLEIAANGEEATTNNRHISRQQDFELTLVNNIVIYSIRDNKIEVREFDPNGGGPNRLFKFQILNNNPGEKGAVGMMPIGIECSPPARRHWQLPFVEDAENGTRTEFDQVCPDDQYRLFLKRTRTDGKRKIKFSWKIPFDLECPEALFEYPILNVYMLELNGEGSEFICSLDKQNELAKMDDEQQEGVEEGAQQQQQLVNHHSKPNRPMIRRRRMQEIIGPSVGATHSGAMNSEEKEIAESLLSLHTQPISAIMDVQLKDTLKIEPKGKAKLTEKTKGKQIIKGRRDNEEGKEIWKGKKRCRTNSGHKTQGGRGGEGDADYPPGFHVPISNYKREKDAHHHQIQPVSPEWEYRPQELNEDSPTLPGRPILSSSINSPTHDVVGASTRMNDDENANAAEGDDGIIREKPIDAAIDASGKQEEAEEQTGTEGRQQYIVAKQHFADTQMHFPPYGGGNLMVDDPLSSFWGTDQVYFD